MTIPVYLQIVAITGAAVVDPSSGEVSRGQTLVIDGPRITAVGPAVAIPPRARRIDGRGKFVVPGLWDMHVHMDVPGGRALLPLYVAQGVTGVRDMNGDLATLRRWQREVDQGSMPGPRMWLSGPYLAGNPVPLPHLLVRTPQDAERAIDSLAALRVDFVKVHNGMPPAAYFAAARAARRRGLTFAGHVFPPLTPEAASDSGQRSQEHLSGMMNDCTPADSLAIGAAHPIQRFLFGECARAPMRAVADRLAKNGTWVTPTLIVQTSLGPLRSPLTANDTMHAYFTDSMRVLLPLIMPYPPSPTTAQTDAGRRLLELRLALVGELHRAGVPILAGTDAPLPPSYPGRGVHDELALLVRAGLTPMAALRTATWEPARYLAATDSLGRVAAGMVADLVVLDADPRDDIANTRRIHLVIARGRVYDAAARRAMYAQAKREVAASR
jgi:hypothetical protein